MYEEDRIRALELYEDIFDSTGNETAVLQLLVSPTRQAVNLARAYDAKERRLQNDDTDAPAYLQVIEQLRRQAMALSPAAVRPENAQPSAEPQKPDDDVNLDGFVFEPAGEKADAGLPDPEPQEINAFPDEDRENQTAPLSAPPAMVQESDRTAPQQNVDEFADAVEAFLADFNISDEAIRAGAPVQNAADTGAADTNNWETPPARVPDEGAANWDLHAGEPAAPAQQPEDPAGQLSAMPPLRESMRRQATAIPEQSAEAPEPKKTVRKPVVGLLILFILLAIPLGLVGVSLILACALISLSMGATGLCAGAFGLMSAFTAFPVFADILLVFGLSLASAAIGLLLFWAFIWLLFGGIPGLIRGICALARKLCYKEVAE